MTVSRKVRASAIVAGALPVAAFQAIAGTGATAQAATTTAHLTPVLQRAGNDPEVTWQDGHDNRYMTVLDASDSDGASVWVSAGDNGGQHHWYAVSSGYSIAGSPLYGMVNVHSDLCLAYVPGHAHLVQEGCGYDHYTYEWVEHSVRAGGPWVLFQGTALDGVAACEDTANLYVNPEYLSPPYPSTCEWH
jgi:hypothetical protein